MVTNQEYTVIGLILFTWFVSMGIQYTGTWYSDYMPVSDSQSYDRFQGVYNVTKILTPDYRLDMQKYKEYSPIYLSTTFALQYGLSFASIIAVVAHTGLFHGKEIWARVRQARNESKDVHMKMMQAYPEVPIWWFVGMFIALLAMGLATTLSYPLQLPWWGFFLAIAMSAFFMVPIGMITAITVGFPPLLLLR
jgi:OPT family oligopeptide transporter